MVVNLHSLTQDNHEHRLSPSSSISKAGTDSTITATVNDPCLSVNMVGIVKHHARPYVDFEHLGK